MFTNDFWGSPLSHPESHKSYRPLTILTFRLNRILHDLSPWGYHLFNVLAHTAVCILFTYFSILFLASTSTGLLAGLIFTLHPIHTEAVSILYTGTNSYCTPLINVIHCNVSELLHVDSLLFLLWICKKLMDIPQSRHFSALCSSMG